MVPGAGSSLIAEAPSGASSMSSGLPDSTVQPFRPSSKPGLSTPRSPGVVGSGVGLVVGSESDGVGVGVGSAVGVGVGSAVGVGVGELDGSGPGSGSSATSPR